MNGQAQHNQFIGVDVAWTVTPQYLTNEKHCTKPPTVLNQTEFIWYGLEKLEMSALCICLESGVTSIVLWNIVKSLRIIAIADAPFTNLVMNVA